MIRTLTSLTMTAAFATLCLAGATGPARAATAGAETVSVRVSTAGLDLGSAAGRDLLGARIAAAARRACGPVYAFDLRQQNSAQACRRSMLESGASRMAELGRTRLAAR